MPTWGKINADLQKYIKDKDIYAFDKIRRFHLEELNKYTKRDTIIYASRWTQGDAPPNLVSINDEDIQGFMESVAGLKGKSLDLILHTGGGSAEASDAIVSYLRSKFDDIRVIIPQAAMSAGTMIACSANVIVMGKQSSIGPIDPQFILQTSVGIQSLPAHAIIEQFKMAQQDCATNPKNLNSWLPMLSQYGPALIVRCHDQIAFGKSLINNWLKEYMFENENDQLAESVAEYLSNHGNFKTHSKHISAVDAAKIGLKIQSLEDDNVLQDKVLSAFHATTIAFGGTPATKIIANHNGNCFVKNMGVAIPSPKKV